MAKPDSSTYPTLRFGVSSTTSLPGGVPPAPAVKHADLPDAVRAPPATDLFLETMVD